ncbi:MAG TPA: HDOD domain-containing protein [Desulfobacteria bacterium]|nr:HDOD domain-containing protein [Desulfobacteria bacterium]
MGLSLNEILNNVEALPTLSPVTHQVLKLTGDPAVSVNDLSDAVLKDQVLTAKVLKMANSAYYGYSRKIVNINEAIIVLGFNGIRSLVLAASVYNIMNREIDGYFLPTGELWKHSMTTALFARTLAQRVDLGLREHAFIAGLIHDIGKIVLNTFLKEQFKVVLNLVETENIPFMEAEKHVLGYDHASVGAIVAESWNLPPVLTEAIALHHSPHEATTNPTLTSIIHVADALSMSIGAGLGGDGMYYPFDGFALEQLNLTSDILEETVAAMTESIALDEAMGLE